MHTHFIIRAIGLFLVLFIFSCQSNDPLASFPYVEEEEEMDKETRMDLAMEQEFEMTVDPALNRIPRERLFLAKNELRRQNNTNQRNAIPGITWGERGPNNVSGRTRDILIDANDATGNTIFAGSVGGGLWKCENALSSNPIWTSVDDFFENLAVCAIGQDPSNNNVLYFGTGEGYYNGDAIAGIGMWKSTDGGVTWSYLSSTSGNTFNYVQQIIINSTGTVFVATRNGGIQRSTDGGTTWASVLGSSSSAQTNRAADLEEAANGDLYAAMGINNVDGIYKSTDNGNTWTKLTSGLPSDDYERIDLACAPSNANVLYALLQDRSDNMCKGIYKSTDGGASWTVKDNPSALGMSNFARNQAWYDLIVAVDPNNSERVLIGGVDILASSDGGDNWTQISQWYGGGGFQEVHADQHVIKFLPGSSSVVFFGNDGGVFVSTNGTATTPTIDFISNGYNVTQFYACAIHPDAGVDYFLAGAQDNGTQRFNVPGINDTYEVTGGDGAFCHIDQNNSLIQISTYVYSNYRVSTNGGNSFSNRNFGNQGRFINPFAYDDEDNKIYGAHNNGQYLRWNDPATGGSDDETVTVSAFNGSKISHVSVSPNVANRIYFGLANGDLVSVDDAHTGTSKTGTVVRAGSGYMSGVAIEVEDEDHILVTYSNYGVTSIYETIDGGSSWQSVEGNLPDIPVRWVIFSPNDADEALIATELGVWSTNDLNGSATLWEASNTGLANVRTDMLKSRTSDNLVIAATHGRGLFSTSRFSELFVSFDAIQNRASEFSNTGSEGACELHFQLLEIPVSINRLPQAGENTTVTFSVVDTSTATAGADFILLNNTLTFTDADVVTTKNLQIKILDDAIEESEIETIILQMTITGIAQAGEDVHKVLVIDNDLSPISTSINVDAEIGTGTVNLSAATPFRGYWEDSKSQYLYLADELLAAGMSPGPITELSFNVSNTGSTQVYTGFTIKMKETSTSSFSGTSTFETGAIEVYSADYDPISGWNTIVLTTPFEWDGSQNLIIETCFDNDSWTDDDDVLATETNFQSVLHRAVDNTLGCDFTTSSSNTSIRPNIRLKQFRDFQIANQVAQKTSFIVANETAHFYDEDGEIMLSVKNLNGGDIGCLEVEIDHYGTAQYLPSWLDGFAHTEKTFLITAENDAPYELTLYASTAELAAWPDPSVLSILKTPGAVTSHTGSDYEVAEEGNMTVQMIGGGTGYAYTTTFSTFSGFALTNAPAVSPLPLDLLSLEASHQGKHNLLTWTTTNEQGVDYMEVQRSWDGQTFSPIDQLDARNNGSVTNAYNLADAELSRKGIDYYYRLRMVDMDGSEKLSSIVSVFVPKQAISWQVAPNPFRDQVQIDLAGGQKEGIAQVTVFNAAGQLLRTFDGAGQSNLSLSLSDLPEGVYWLKINSTDGTATQRRVVKVN